MADDENIECGVCFEPNVLEDLQCCEGSICKSCLDVIIDRSENPTCPFCRRDIVKSDYSRNISDVKVAKSDPTIKDWLTRQSRATPGVPIRVALQIYKLLATYRPGYEDNLPNFDYLFIGYYYSVQDLWDDIDRRSEFNRLREFTAQLDNYRPPFEAVGKDNGTRLFPDVRVKYSPPSSRKTSNVYNRKSIVTKPSYDTKPKKLPPPLPSSSLSGPPKPLPPPSYSSSSRAPQPLLPPPSSSRVLKTLPPSYSSSSSAPQPLLPPPYSSSSSKAPAQPKSLLSYVSPGASKQPTKSTLDFEDEMEEE